MTLFYYLNLIFRWRFCNKWKRNTYKRVYKNDAIVVVRCVRIWFVYFTSNLLDEWTIKAHLHSCKSIVVDFINVLEPAFALSNRLTHVKIGRNSGNKIKQSLLQPILYASNFLPCVSGLMKLTLGDGGGSSRATNFSLNFLWKDKGYLRLKWKSKFYALFQETSLRKSTRSYKNS